MRIAIALISIGAAVLIYALLHWFLVPRRVVLHETNLPVGQMHARTMSDDTLVIGRYDATGEWVTIFEWDRRWPVILLLSDSPLQMEAPYSVSVNGWLFDTRDGPVVRLKPEWYSRPRDNGPHLRAPVHSPERRA